MSNTQKVEREKTCAERISNQLAGEEENLKEIYEAMDRARDEDDSQKEDDAYEALNNYALGINTIKETTITLSWGGPASYLEVLHDGTEITQLTYRFSDWFDTATEIIYDEESSLYRYAQEIINIQEGAY